MFDIGWSEMAIIALVALVVIGPKDLPKVLRTMGQFMRKARSLSREFQSGLNDMLREAELDEARKAIEGTRAGQLDKEIRKALDPDDEVEKELRDLDREARASKVTADKDSPAKAAGKERLAKSTREPESQSQPRSGNDDGKVVKHPAGGASASSESPNVSEKKVGEIEEATVGQAKKTG